MDYLGKKLQAGQLALDSPVQSAVKEKPERAPHRRRTVELWPETGLTVAQSHSRNQWHFWQARFCWIFGDHCWQGTQLLLLSCQVGWTESCCLVLCRVPCKQRKREKKEIVKWETKSKWDVQGICGLIDIWLESAALRCPPGTWWVLSYSMWQRWMETASLLLMLDLVGRRNWLVIYHP